MFSNIKDDSEIGSVLSKYNIWPKPVDHFVAFYNGREYPADTYLHVLFPLNITEMEKNGITILPSSSVREKVVLDALDSDVKLQFKKFATVGALVDVRQYEPLIRAVEEDCLETSNPNNPFIAVLAPSGSGKTQLAFALDILRPVVRITFSVPSHTRQAVYNGSGGLGQEIIHAANVDFVEGLRNTKANARSCNFLKEFSNITKLKLAGFLKELIGIRLDPSKAHLIQKFDERFDIVYNSCTVGELVEYIQKYATKPVMILDEFHRKYENDDDWPCMIYCRNLIRTVGLVCIVMGTDSSAKNVIETAGADSGNIIEGAPKPWVYVVHELPKCLVKPISLSTTKISRSTFPDYNEMAQLFLSLPIGLKHRYVKLVHWITKKPSIRPLTLTLAFEFLKIQFQKIVDGNQEPLSIEQLFGGLVEHVRATIMARKEDTLRGENGVIGQFALNCGDFRHGKGQNGPDFLIHSHYAFLNSPDFECSWFSLHRKSVDKKNYLFTSEGLSNICAATSWNPESFFPESPSDELMEIVLVGQISASCYLRNISTYDAYVNNVRKKFHNIVSAIGKRRHLRLGSMLESITMVAIINASHRCGYGGISLELFLPRLVSEFYPFRLPDNPALNPSCDLYQHLQDGTTFPFHVPFFAPLDSSFSADLTSLSQAFYFASIRTGRDNEELDGISDCGNFMFTVECKNHEAACGESIPRKHLPKGRLNQAHLIIMCVSKFIKTINAKTFSMLTEETGKVAKKLNSGGLRVYLADQLEDDQVSFSCIYNHPQPMPQRRGSTASRTVRNVLILLPVETLIPGVKLSHPKSDIAIKRSLENSESE